MITARNYAAQAERAMMLMDEKDWQEKGGNWNPIYGAIATGIHTSVHFAIPDGGKIINDDLRGLDGQMLGLPYEQTVIEFHDEGKKVVLYLMLGEKSLWSEKWGKKFPKPDCEKCGVWIMECKEGLWRLNPHAVTFRYNVEYNASEYKILNNEIHANSLLVDCFATSDITLTEKEKAQSMSMAKKCLFVVFELIEALSCANVATEVLEKTDLKKNKKRIKAGKLPLYETRVLVVKTPQNIKKCQFGGGGTHASPRQHLRRGHIRRLPSGNVWVNSCVVGDPRKGRINKSYQVTGGAREVL